MKRPRLWKWTLLPVVGFIMSPTTFTSAGAALVAQARVNMLTALETPEALKELSHLARAKSQNYFHPGCGVGRETAGAALNALKQLALRSPAKVIAMTEDPDPETRNAAALVLGSNRERSAVSSLTRLLKEDPEPYVRAAAAAALLRIGTPRTLSILRSEIHNDGLEARAMAAVVWARKGDREALKVLKALSNPDQLSENGPIGSDASRAYSFASTALTNFQYPYWLRD